MSWSTSLGFGVWLGAVVAKSSRQSGPGLRNHTHPYRFDILSLAGFGCTFVPPAQTSPDSEWDAVQSAIERIPRTHQPPQFPWQPRGRVPRAITTKSRRALRLGCEFRPRSTQDQQQQHQQQAAPDTTAACRLILTRFRAGALFPTTVLSFPSINISSLDRYSHQPFVHHTRYTRSLSQRSTTTHPHSGDSSFRRDPNTQSVADPVMTTAGLTDKHSIGPPQFGTTNDLPSPCSKTH